LDTTASHGAVPVGVRRQAAARDPALEAAGRTSLDPATWTRLEIEAVYRWPDGTRDRVEVDTLQGPDWLAAHAVAVGRQVPLPLGLVEMGLPEGLEGRVTAIAPCPPIRPGPGRVVLSTVSHLNADVHQLTVADGQGRQEILHPTGTHRFYSITRRAWIAAGQLRRGEQLDGLGTPVTVVDVRRLPGVRRVYNLTVEGRHMYRVARWGVLVHNNGCGAGQAGHIAEWELRGPRGGRLSSGTEISGVDFALPPGIRLSFPEQSWYGHTEGKVISDLMDSGKLMPGRTLMIEGELPPCSNCRSIMQWTSEQFQMIVDYVDATGQTWTWINGMLQ